MDTLNESIAFRLRLARKAKKLTQEKLAKACGISRQTIYEYEKGLYIPKLDNAGKLAKVLDVTLDYLCYGKDRDPIYIEKPYLLTYKDLMRSYLHLLSSNLFTISNDFDNLTITTTEKTFIKTYMQVDNINSIRGSLSKETYEAAISDILNKVDFTIRKK